MMKVKNKAIDMIGWTDTDGIFHPMKIRILDKHNKNQIYDVTQVLSRSTEKLAGNIMIIYDCRINIKDKDRECIIKFEVDSCRWKLFKI